ncbi:hypothetical protein C2G38_2201692 [Gigaspora rosea]|uniref:Uncharacterized protein n=1 Tax=Gigaspora rosea TaxID=44941 RepID=A0A397UR48_9GLOM|nr:hypothetical protein C2G38_2201692 [Gigaspora rosea]
MSFTQNCNFIVVNIIVLIKIAQASTTYCGCSESCVHTSIIPYNHNAKHKAQNYYLFSLFNPKKLLQYIMLVINVQIIKELKVLFDWKIIPVQTVITIEQFFLELMEEYMLNEHSELIEKVEVRCGNSKTTVN